MEVIDTHCHFSEPPRPDRPHDPKWTSSKPPLPVEELLEAARIAGVTKIVQVTSIIMGYDNSYSFESAERFPDQILGVFARFDPLGKDMPERLAEIRKQPALLGVRLTLMWPGVSEWLTDGTIEPFLAEAGNQGVPVAIAAANQAKAMGEAARRHPKTRILVDHMGVGHSSDAEPFARWDDALALAGIPNIWVKVSYFPELAHEPYPFVNVQRRFREMFDRFGGDRLIWGSDYPPSKHVCTYKQSVDFVRVECDFLSEADKTKIFGGTFRHAVKRDAIGASAPGEAAVSRLQVRRLGYALGAEITGVDCTQPLGDEVVARIREAWLEHVVVCFPGQDLGPPEFVAFCSQLGEVDDNRVSPHTNYPGYSPVKVINNKPTTVNGKTITGIYADRWHSDHSHTERPHAATLLNAKELPEIGGDTMFANMYMAFDALSPAMQRLIEPLSCVHDAMLMANAHRESPELQAQRRRLTPPVVQPLIRVHPETGRKVLYIGERIRNFVGMTEEESKPLLGFLQEHAVRYEFVYRHRWRQSDLVMWDNRCALHYAIPDYDLSQNRRMLRCTLLGAKTGYFVAAGVG